MGFFFEIIHQSGAHVGGTGTGDAVAPLMPFKPLLINLFGLIVGIGAVEQDNFSLMLGFGKDPDEIVLRPAGFGKDNGFLKRFRGTGRCLKSTSTARAPNYWRRAR